MSELQKVTLSSAKLKQARESAYPDKSATEVAGIIGISKQALRDIESGRSYPSAPVLTRMCLLYGTDLRRLTTADLADENFFRNKYGNA